MKTVELKQNIFKQNEVTADKIREELKAKGVYLINVMSSPGSGKTTTLVRAIQMLQRGICTNENRPCSYATDSNGKDLNNPYPLRCGVLECDIDASVDAEAIINAGGKAVQLHTGGMCHMDACMTKQGLDELGIDDLDLVFIENVGNLVCPAEFDTGAHTNITILSIPEGSDKPAKYPLMYQVCDLIIINKIDAEPAFDFNRAEMEKYVNKCNPNADIIYISAKTGEGFEKFISWCHAKYNTKEN